MQMIAPEQGPLPARVLYSLEDVPDYATPAERLAAGNPSHPCTFTPFHSGLACCCSLRTAGVRPALPPWKQANAHTGPLHCMQDVHDAMRSALC